ncbi:hypothetical protein [Clavibacter michiganensis]|uniref:hypothetical protein n=1 Tax=Clavibacter michiganensis TaxID=28447 RepID=UPI0011982961|nr:hypothetical protein [Clavibacter michiganensis]
MSHSAQIVQVMISSPSDLPEEHRAIIQRAMRVWNLTHGKLYGIHFSPTDWQEGGSPAFGTYPQEVLNEQVVDDSDVALVVFTDRLGTPTPEHESGTTEEISRLLEAGKDVAVLQNQIPRSPLRGAQVEQKRALEEYLGEIRDRAFMGEYESEERLREITDSLLSRLAAKFKRDLDAAFLPAEPRSTSVVDTNAADSERSQGDLDESLGVWPRVEVSDYAETDGKGRLRNKRRWRLVLQSNLNIPVKNVAYHYVNDDGTPSSFDAFGADEDRATAIIPPQGSVSFPIFQSMASDGSALCVVEWDDSNGTRRATKATVRTA